jgi:hypothetical protein
MNKISIPSLIKVGINVLQANLFAFISGVNAGMFLMLNFQYEE